MNGHDALTRCQRRYGQCNLRSGHRGDHDAYDQSIPWCPSRHLSGAQCERARGHSGRHAATGDEWEAYEWGALIPRGGK